jgi:hypothetical protein
VKPKSSRHQFKVGESTAEGTMHKTSIPALLLAFLCAGNHPFSTAQAQGTAFTYQGRLNTGGAAANGSYDLQFTLYATNVNGAALAGPVTNPAVAVTNGLFATTINFGNVFTGASNWLAIAVSTNAANAFSTLAPRQQLTPVPYAITAANVSGALVNANLPASPTVSGTVTAGSFAGNGANLTGVNAAALNGLNATDFWQLGGNNVAAGQFLGSLNNQPVEIWANGSRALRLEPNATAPNVIGGSVANSDSATPGVVGATIGGGIYNTNAASYAFIGGGSQNLIQTNANDSVIGGGSLNTIQTNSSYAVIAGGYGNMVQTNAYNAVIGGGAQNTIQSFDEYCMIGSGIQNTIQRSADYAVIVGGTQNTIQSCVGSTIGGGYWNTMAGYYSMIGGGNYNTIQNSASCATIGGGYYNVVSGTGGFIGGGGCDGIYAQGNGNAGNASSIVGGLDNLIASGGDYSIIGGGDNNTIQTNAFYSVVAGGASNTIQTNAAYSLIGGGDNNTIQELAECSTIGGGDNNTIQDLAEFSTIGGGSWNWIQVNAQESVISGGDNNVVSGVGDFIGGGGYDGSYSIGNNNAGNAAVIVGGMANAIASGGNYSVIPGGYGNSIGASAQYAFAAGNSAQANHSGAFVWSDNSGAGGIFSSTGPNQFLIRAQGGVGIGATNLAVGGALTIRSPNAAPPIAMNAADNALVLGSAGVSSYKWLQSYGGSLTLNPLGNYVGVNTANPVHPFQVVNAYCDGNTWFNSSDKNLKENFAALDAAQLLQKIAQLPVTEWNYKTDNATVKHIGPMAQDFHAAFGLGPNDTTISTVDEGGVALAAIQGLNQRVEELKNELNRKDAENAELAQRLEKLERLVTERLGGTGTK